MAQKKRSNWNSVQMLIVALLGAGLGVLATLYAKDLIEIITPVALTVLSTLFVVAVLLYFAITLYRDKIIRYLFGEDIHFDSALNEAQDIVKQTIVGTTEAIPGLPAAEKKRLQQAAPRVANYLIWSQFRSQGLRLMIGFFVAVGGLATTMLLFNQNRLLERQNEKIDMQMSLEESNRRSSMVFQMANILDKVDEELRDTFNTNHGTRRLSEQLILRIEIFSDGLKPYRYLDGNTLSRELSPERGRLLYALINSNLDTITLTGIYNQVTFKKADLGGRRIANTFLDRIDLQGANLDSSSLLDLSFCNAILKGATFRGSELKRVDFSFADLSNSRFDGTQTIGYLKKHLDLLENNPAKLEKVRSLPRPIVFVGTILEGAILSDAAFNFADFRFAELYLANLSNTDFRGADLSCTRVLESDLSGANLSHTTLTRADFQSSKLTSVSFRNADVQDAYLDRTVLIKTQHLKKEQLATCNSLFNSTGLNRDLENSLRKIDHKLFLKPLALIIREEDCLKERDELRSKIIMAEFQRTERWDEEAKKVNLLKKN